MAIVVVYWFIKIHLICFTIPSRVYHPPVAVWRRLLIYFDADFTGVDDEKWTRHDFDVGPGRTAFGLALMMQVGSGCMCSDTRLSFTSRDSNVSGSCLISIRMGVATFPSVGIVIESESYSC